MNRFKPILNHFQAIIYNKPANKENGQNKTKNLRHVFASNPLYKLVSRVIHIHFYLRWTKPKIPEIRSTSGFPRPGYLFDAHLHPIVKKFFNYFFVRSKNRKASFMPKVKTAPILSRLAYHQMIERKTRPL